MKNNTWYLKQDEEKPWIHELIMIKMRHQAITNRDFAKKIEVYLKNMGYTEITNVVIGETEGWMLIDTEKLSYTFFEFDGKISYTDLWMYDDKDINDLFEVQC